LLKKINSEITNSNQNIRRRKFFLYLGISIVGIISFTKSPFKLFKSKIKNDIIKTNNILITSNPSAVKREPGGPLNG
jgi:hypothetical protein